MRSLLQARIASIWSTLAEYVVGITALRVDYHSFKLTVTLTDGSTIRVNEQYHQHTLERYAYYWLNTNDCLITGWDNAPHHSHLAGFPHHKHIASQENVRPSEETTPKEILIAIRNHLS